MRALSALVRAASLLFCTGVHAQLTLSTLRVENKVAPLGIDVTPNPTVLPSPLSPGALAFRRTFTSSAGKPAARAAIVTADDQFALWVDGAHMGSAPDEPDVWETAQMFTVPLNSSGSTLFAVLATNLADVNSGEPSPAGVLASINILYADGSSESFTTDMAWRVSPASVNDVGFNDSAWGAAVGLGAFGVQPWGTGVSVQDPLGEHPEPLLRKAFGVSKQNSSGSRVPVQRTLPAQDIYTPSAQTTHLAYQTLQDLKIRSRIKISAPIARVFFSWSVQLPVLSASPRVLGLNPIKRAVKSTSV
ncbi:hypothetical protein C8R44DRAFT_745536 [Mycena epipterygia]|nr:hypothetical protein C8R44DRAFT_745536 [Mycena epipterygia]